MTARAEVEHDAAFELRDVLGEDQEVGVAGPAEDAAVALGCSWMMS